MRSARLSNQFRTPSFDVGEGSVKREEDICSLNSWTDDVGIISHRSLSQSSSVDSNCLSDLKISSEKNHVYSSVSRKDASPKDDDPAQRSDQSIDYKDVFKHITADNCVQHRPIDRTYFRESQSVQKTFNQNDYHLPPSLDLKSASFEYPSLWRNPLCQDSEENVQSVISKDGKQHPNMSGTKELSSPPSYKNNVQRLYPNLEELNSNSSRCDMPMYPANGSPSQYSSKVSPSRPRYFDFKKGMPHKAQRDSYVPYQTEFQDKWFNSDARRSITTTISKTFPSTSVTLSQRNSQSCYDAPSLFKSQPALLPQQGGLSLKPNNSANDLKLVDKQVLEHRLEPENMKSKMMCVWNNLKYGWTFKSKSSIKPDSPLFLLGKDYHKKNDDDEEPDYLRDFTSKIWLTYRSNFYPIPGTKLNTDCGWGCMIRSGQMLIAQCLVTHFLGRDWHLNDHQDKTQSSFYKEIVRWFSDPVDAPSDKMPFCLHHLVNFGRQYNKVPGEWYGPASVAYIFRDVLNRASMTIPILKDICIYVAQDCTVYIEDIHKLCRTRSESTSSSESSPTSNPHSSSQFSLGTHDRAWCRSLIILIPVRLGGMSMNEIYSPCIKNLLSYKKCTGIIGGKPKHSLYFVGYQDDKLIYLDPHYCQEAIDVKSKEFNYESYHCTSPRKLTMNKMDPSCTVGFYIKDAKDFQKFVQEVTEFISPPKQKGLYPLFVFSNGSQEEAELAHGKIGMEQGRVKVKHYVIDEHGQRHRSVTRESEEFIML